MVFNKVKKWLGIEGVKMEIVLPEGLVKEDQLVTGEIKYSTMNTQRILTTKVKIYELYTRGRGKKKKTNEYLLGEVLLSDAFMVYPEEEKLVSFKLPFKLEKSEMDRMQDRGGFMGSFASIAKKTRGVKSEYKLVAEAEVAGTALSPFAESKIVWKR